MRSLWLAVALAACGDVQKVPDAAVVDAYQADAAVEVTCEDGEMTCNGICANLMTDELYCGNCNTQCSPTQACVGGTCVPANTSCNRVREIDPAAGDGVYTNPNTGKPFFCDFTNGRTIEDLAMGQYNVSHTGYSLITYEQLTDPTFQAVFIGLYNHQAGMNLIAQWVSTNCCFSLAGGLEPFFGGSYLYPSTGTGYSCSPPSPGYTGGPWLVYQADLGKVATPPLQADFFTTNPVTQVDQCSDGANPGLFWKIRNSLN